MAKILIVDDENSIRVLFQYIFSEAGHTVAVAENGKTALGMLESFMPDIILLDIAMPEMGGPEFVENWEKKAQALPELRDIPFLVMTGQNYITPSTPEGLENKKNFHSFLPKMTDPDAVLATVTSALKKAGRT
jgi:CheY-like chemotaxis protein